MVVVPKANGKVQIFIYLTKLNKSILREYHSLPSVDHTFAQLAGVTISSKLDANSGFWQIGLSPESAKLTGYGVKPNSKHLQPQRRAFPPPLP